MANKQQKTNYAFIDSQNVNLAILDLGWKLDFKRFRVYLRDKYNVEKAYLFIGYIPENADLYKNLQDAGFSCIFKPTINQYGKTKGNCDAELVLHAMIEFNNYGKAVLVTGDGDFQCLVKYLHEQDKLATLIIPNEHKYSALFKTPTFRPYHRFMNDLQTKLQYKIPKQETTNKATQKKNPRKDKTLKG